MFSFSLVLDLAMGALLTGRLELEVLLETSLALGDV